MRNKLIIIGFNQGIEIVSRRNRSLTANHSICPSAVRHSISCLHDIELKLLSLEVIGQSSFRDLS